MKSNRFSLKFKKARNLIVSLFQKEFLGEDGFPVFSINSFSGDHLDKSSSITELGDYLPFMAYYGQEVFVDSQINLVEKYFNSKKFIWNSHTRLPKHSWSFEYTDLILGLLQCYEVLKISKYLKVAEDVLNFVLAKFFRQGFICSHYFSIPKGPLPIASSICTMYSELLVDFYRLTGKHKYLLLSEKLMKKMVESVGFKRYGMFPTYYPIKSYLRFFLGPVSLSRQYDSSKYNCTASSSLISLYEATGDEYYVRAYRRWFKGVNTYLKYPSGGYADKAVISRGIARRTGLELINFHYLESFCDAYHFLGDTVYLEEATNLSLFWLEKMGKTGLLPLKYEKKYSSFDAETDFIIGLGKLYELSRKNIYKAEAEKMLTGIFNYHKAPFGFVESVDIDSGKILNPTIETRFLSLFLKANILFDNDFKSYKKRKIFSLLRDR